MRWDDLVVQRRLQRDHRPLLITAIAALSCVGTSWLASRCVERPAQLLTSSPNAEDDAASDEPCEVALLAPHTPSREPVVLDEPKPPNDPSLELRRRTTRLIRERLAEERGLEKVSLVAWDSFPGARWTFRIPGEQRFQIDELPTGEHRLTAMRSDENGATSVDATLDATELDLRFRIERELAELRQR